MEEKFNGQGLLGEENVLNGAEEETSEASVASARDRQLTGA